MKIIAFSLACLPVTLVANAQSNNLPGGYTNRTLKCITDLPISALDFGLVIQTQALGPEYFVRGGYLEITEYFMGKYTYYKQMTMLKQDINYAYFNIDTQYNVKFNKRNFTAQILNEGKIYYNCQELK